MLKEFVQSNNLLLETFIFTAKYWEELFQIAKNMRVGAERRKQKGIAILFILLAKRRVYTKMGTILKIRSVILKIKIMS